MSLEEIRSKVTAFEPLEEHEITKGVGWTCETHRISERRIYQPPYSLTKVKEFETRNEIQLPEQFKTYLTEISRSLFKNHLEFSIIELKDEKNLKRACGLHEVFNSCPEEPDFEDDDDEAYDLWEDNHPLRGFHGLLDLRHVRCGHTDRLVLNGKYKGTVWRELFAGDGGILRTHSSFYEYALDQGDFVSRLRGFS